jgi:hypothetical protein
MMKEISLQGIDCELSLRSVMGRENGGPLKWRTEKAGAQTADGGPK